MLFGCGPGRGLLPSLDIGRSYMFSASHSPEFFILIFLTHPFAANWKTNAFLW